MILTIRGKLMFLIHKFSAFLTCSSGVVQTTEILNEIVVRIFIYIQNITTTTSDL